MQITILGKYGPYSPAGGACSGYLLQTEGLTVLLDCGNGILSRLQQFCDLEKLDLIILSHLHSDHMGDMLILRYALQILKKANIRTNPIKVLAPKTPQEEFSMLFRENVFDIAPIEDGMHVTVGNTTFEFFVVSHPVETYAVRILHQGKVFCFSGDTNSKGKENVERAAKQADVFLCDANFTDESAGALIPHLTAGEAGEAAAKANVKRLILTHLNPRLDENMILNQASAKHKNVCLAQELETLTI